MYQPCTMYVLTPSRFRSPSPLQAGPPPPSKSTLGLDSATPHSFPNGLLGRGQARPQAPGRRSAPHRRSEVAHRPHTWSRPNRRTAKRRKSDNGSNGLSMLDRARKAAVDVDNPPPPPRLIFNWLLGNASERGRFDHIMWLGKKGKRGWVVVEGGENVGEAPTVKVKGTRTLARASQHVGGTRGLITRTGHTDLRRA